MATVLGFLSIPIQQFSLHHSTSFPHSPPPQTDIRDATRQSLHNMRLPEHSRILAGGWNADDVSSDRIRTAQCDYTFDMILPITQSQIPPDIIDLGAGEPNQSVFPLDMIHRAAEERFSKGDPSFLQYGTEQGDGYFRLALAKFLNQGYGLPMNPENIFITAGISSALD